MATPPKSLGGADCGPRDLSLSGYAWETLAFVTVIVMTNYLLYGVT
jgi:hypothetical protein